MTFCAEHVREIRTAVIYEKPHSIVKCDYVWRPTDKWINFPWSSRRGMRKGVSPCQAKLDRPVAQWRIPRPKWLLSARMSAAHPPMMNRTNCGIEVLPLSVGGEP